MEDQDNDLLVTFNAIAAYCFQSNIPVAVIGRINTKKQQDNLSRWKPAKLQDSEWEAQQKREAASKQPAARKSDEVKIPKGLAPHLHEHYRQMHKKSETTTAASQPASQASHYKSLAESAVASIRSNLDRAEAQRLLTRVGKWGWKLVYRSVTS